jgi:F-type H+-transporting ATPase subunit b
MHIDWWTLALQTVNVLVLIWILARFFFRPVADIVAKRQRETSKLLAEAAAAQKEAADLRAENNKTRAASGTERDRLFAEARKAAEAEKASLLAQSSAEIDKLHNEAKAAMARERAAAGQAILAHAGELSIDIARRLLSRLPTESTFSVFLEGACRELQGLAADVRNSSFVPGTGGAVDVVTAAPLSGPQMTLVRDALARVLGVEPGLTFRTDPTLIAGIELHGRNIIVRNCWRADLDRISAELCRD